MSGRITHLTVRLLDRMAKLLLRPPAGPAHQLTGTRGEEDAYFYLRRQGYVMVARNYRSPHRRGEIDLIGWDGEVLCFIEVKTRTTRDAKPAEAASAMTSNTWSREWQKNICGRWRAHRAGVSTYSVSITTRPV